MNENRMLGSPLTLPSTSAVPYSIAYIVGVVKRPPHRRDVLRSRGGPELGHHVGKEP